MGTRTLLIAGIVFTLAAYVSAAGAGEPLPPRAVARLGSDVFWSGPLVESVAVSPDGKSIATLGQVVGPAPVPDFGRPLPFAVTLFDAASGRVVWTRVLRGRRAEEVVFVPGGGAVAVYATQAVTFLDPATGRELRTITPKGMFT